MSVVCAFFANQETFLERERLFQNEMRERVTVKKTIDSWGKKESVFRLFQIELRERERGRERERERA